MPFLPADQLPLWANAGIFLLGTIAVWFCGTRLTRYVDRISETTGLGQAFAGMLFLGVITSLPEVANTISASAAGNPALAINNLLGSAAINVVLLVVGDAVIRRGALTSRTDSPSVLMMGMLCILLLLAVAVAATVGDVAIGGIGAWSPAIAGLSVLAFWMASGYADRSPWRVAGGQARAEPGQPASGGSLRAAVVMTVIVGAAIFAAGVTLSVTGDALAVQTGMGSGLVGFILIGVATSAPELSTVVEAVRLKRYEMAFGQVLGTNFVNLALILLADAIYPGEPIFDVLGPFEVVSALLGAVLIGVFMIGVLERRERTVLRMGIDSVVVAALFVGGVALLTRL